MKKFLSILTSLTIITVATSFPETNAIEFPDVRSPILAEAVDYLSDRGIIKGYPDGTFKPERVINRAEALKIIFESIGIEAESDTESGFSDVNPSEWYARHVTTAKKRGLIKGYKDGSYRPIQEVNKAEFIKMATIAQSYFSFPSLSNAAHQQFDDLHRGEWYVPHIEFALSLNFLDRTSKFHPLDGMTRGEAALIIFKIVQHNEALAAGEEQGKQDALENSALISCETCVNGEDVMKKYPFLEDHPLVEIKDGKLFIADEDVSKYTHDLRSIEITFANAEILDIVDTTSYEDTIRLEEIYPEHYARLVGINGGVQTGSEYIEGFTGLYRNKDGNKFKNCDCYFELTVINIYNGKDSELTFHNWITTDEAKERYLVEIVADIYNNAHP